jgi:hypothetical protein
MNVGGQLHVPAALSPLKYCVMAIGEEAGWVLEQVRALWRRQKSRNPAGDRTPVLQLVADRYSFIHQWLYSPLLGPGLFSFVIFFFTQMVELLEE